MNISAGFDDPIKAKHAEIIMRGVLQTLHDFHVFLDKIRYDTSFSVEDRHKQLCDEFPLIPKLIQLPKPKNKDLFMNYLSEYAKIYSWSLDSGISPSIRSSLFAPSPSDKINYILISSPDTLKHANWKPIQLLLFKLGAVHSSINSMLPVIKPDPLTITPLNVDIIGELLLVFAT
jgi:hypothetical protein